MTKRQQLSAARSPEAQSKIWEQRTRLAEEELNSERATSIAKTIKLKTLRLDAARCGAEVPGRYWLQWSVSGRRPGE